MMHAVDRLHRLPGSFSLVRCAECGLARLSPRPAVEQLSRYYPADRYYSAQDPSASVHTLKPRPILKGVRGSLRNAALASLGYPVHAPPLLPTRWLAGVSPVRKLALYGLPERFPAYVRAGKALDVGSGNATFLSYLKHHGWEVVGVDISRAAAEAAKRAFDIDVLLTPLESAPFDPEEFDLVYFNHSLEHVPEPKVTLDRAAELLKPDGRIYIETPNLSALNARICRQYWLPLEAPRHLYLFSPPTLRRLIRAAGLDVESLRSKGMKQIFAWEDTFRREELLRQEISPRPRLRPRARPRAALYRAAGAAYRLVNPLCGDILSCWAVKPSAG